MDGGLIWLFCLAVVLLYSDWQTNRGWYVKVVVQTPQGPHETRLDSCKRNKLKAYAELQDSAASSKIWAYPNFTIKDLRCCRSYLGWGRPAE